MATKNEQGSTYTAEQVSQGGMVLRTPLRKAIFIGGLVLLGIASIFIGWHGR